MANKNDWDWHGEDAKESIVVRPVLATAVYVNPHGDIVIRQQDSMGDEDSVVIFPVKEAASIVNAIMAAVDAAKED